MCGVAFQEIGRESRAWRRDVDDMVEAQVMVSGDVYGTMKIMSYHEKGYDKLR